MATTTQQQFIFDLWTNGKEKQVTFTCTTNSGNMGFQHRATATFYTAKGFDYTDKFYKVQYYNRTWESYRYQSLLAHTTRQLLKENYITKEEEQQLQDKISNLPYNLTYNSVVRF